MIVKNIKLTHVRVPLVEPFRISSGAVAEKDAIVVRVETEELSATASHRRWQVRSTRPIHPRAAGGSCASHCARVDREELYGSRRQAAAWK